MRPVLRAPAPSAPPAQAPGFQPYLRALVGEGSARPGWAAALGGGAGGQRGAVASSCMCSRAWRVGVWGGQRGGQERQGPPPSSPRPRPRPAHGRGRAGPVPAGVRAGPGRLRATRLDTGSLSGKLPGSSPVPAQAQRRPRPPRPAWQLPRLHRRRTVAGGGPGALSSRRRTQPPCAGQRTQLRRRPAAPLKTLQLTLQTSTRPERLPREGRGPPKTLGRCSRQRHTQENLASSRNGSGWATPCGVAEESSCLQLQPKSPVPVLPARLHWPGAFHPGFHAHQL
ncbi:uncharacterized protein LOC110348804 [Heterocephalus glaber]|uniref:Uncharacterized protein LOC110348804 n=1 Tax=Heterocephalus glaber TaxID=10181 RepID=A0AAX6SXW2_HETGA|nr:uncharacterized protein LOC110348804 [Heterocephalus glaber]